MNEEERIVWAILKHRARGRAQALTNQQVAQMAGMEQRHVRALIARLVVDHGQLIGSASGQGVFVIETEADLAAAERCLDEHAKPIFQRKAAIRRAWNGRQTAGLGLFGPPSAVA